MQLDKLRLKKIKGDASFRSFYRKEKNNKKSILVYATKEKEKNLLVYDAINKLLIKNKILAPKLYKENYKKNFIEIEDFGDDTIFKLLKRKGSNKIDLYKQSIYLLNKIQKIRQNHTFKIVTMVSKDNLNDYNGTIPLKGYSLGPSAAMISRSNFYLGLDNGLTHIASCFDVKMLSVHIGYPVECAGPLSPFATVVAHRPFDPPESISVDEVYKAFQELI